MKYQEQENYKQQEKERKQLENDMEYYRNQYEMLDEKQKIYYYKKVFRMNYNNNKNQTEQVQELLLLNQQQRKESKPPLQQILINQPLYQNQSRQLEEKLNQKQRPQSGSIKKRRTVRKEDIKDLGLEVNMRFRLRKLQLENVIENDLFDSLIKQKGKISIKDIAVKLSDKPFELKEVEKIYLMARYMIEDNIQDWVEYDEEATCQLQIGSVKYFLKKEEIQYINEINSQIIKFKKSVLSYLPTFNQPQLTKDQMTKAFNYIGIHLSNEVMDYFFLRLFELQGESDVRKFDNKLLIEEWGKDKKNKIINKNKIEEQIPTSLMDKN